MDDCASITPAEPCPDCNDTGVVVSCANDGRWGCSHTNDTERPCNRCT